MVVKNTYIKLPYSEGDRLEEMTKVKFSIEASDDISIFLGEFHFEKSEETRELIKQIKPQDISETLFANGNRKLLKHYIGWIPKSESLVEFWKFGKFVSKLDLSKLPENKRIDTLNSITNEYIKGVNDVDFQSK